MTTILIKLTLVSNIFLLLVCCSENKTESKLHSKNTKSFQLHYSLTRMVVSEVSNWSKEIVTTGTFYGSDDYCLNQNERVTYIREKSQCLIITKISPKVCIQLDTANAITYLSAEPANDIYLLLKLVSNLKSTGVVIGSNFKQFKYFIGNSARSIDSIYVTYKLESNFPDNIIYISKKIGGSQALNRSVIKDSLKIISTETLPKMPKFNSIAEYLQSDTIKNRVIKFKPQ